MVRLKAGTKAWFAAIDATMVFWSVGVIAAAAQINQSHTGAESDSNSGSGLVSGSDVGRGSSFDQPGRAVPTLTLPKKAKNDRTSSWFQRYDEIRHRAQMSDAERDSSRVLLTQGIASSLLQTGESKQDKAAATALLTRMVDRYHRALADLSAVPEINETRKLQLGYEQYFQAAGALFADYLKIQGNLFATDAAGNSIVGQLQQRKADLEALDAANKGLDAKLRARYHIASYAW